MRKKEEKLVIAFRSTHDAMAFEEACKGAGAPGRLIPLPGEISAGCGLAWCAPLSAETELRERLSNAGITPDAVRSCMV